MRYGAASSIISMLKGTALQKSLGARDEPNSESEDWSDGDFDDDDDTDDEE